MLLHVAPGQRKGVPLICVLTFVIAIVVIGLVFVLSPAELGPALSFLTVAYTGGSITDVYVRGKCNPKLRICTFTSTNKVYELRRQKVTFEII